MRVLVVKNFGGTNPLIKNKTLRVKFALDIFIFHDCKLIPLNTMVLNLSFSTEKFNKALCNSAVHPSDCIQYKSFTKKRTLLFENC